jgi:hypothetical protein
LSFVHSRSLGATGRQLRFAQSDSQRMLGRCLLAASPQARDRYLWTACARSPQRIPGSTRICAEPGFQVLVRRRMPATSALEPRPETAPLRSGFPNLAQKVVGAKSLLGYGRARLPTRPALGRGTLTQPNRGSHESHTSTCVLAALVWLTAVGAGAGDNRRRMPGPAHDVARQHARGTGVLHQSGERGGLVTKLDAASAKLAAGKNTDAVAKLVDFQTTLNTLATAPKPKVDPAVEQALRGDAQRVIDCINEIGTA